MKRFVYEFATQDCPDIALSSEEAYDYAGRLGDFHEGYWAGYHDCALALSSTLGRMAPRELIEGLRNAKAAEDAEADIEDALEEGGLHSGDRTANGLAFWGEGSRFARALEASREDGEDDV